MNKYTILTCSWSQLTDLMSIWHFAEEILPELGTNEGYLLYEMPGMSVIWHEESAAG